MTWFSSVIEEMRFVTVTLHAGVSEKITISDGQTVTTDSTGNARIELRPGSYTFTGSISGQTFERTVGINISDVYVMPEGSLYWYGNFCSWLTGGWDNGIYVHVKEYAALPCILESNNILFKPDATKDYQERALVSSNSINLAKYRSLKIKITNGGTSIIKELDIGGISYSAYIIARLLNINHETSWDGGGYYSAILASTAKENFEDFAINGVYATLYKPGEDRVTANIKIYEIFVE